MFGWSETGCPTCFGLARTGIRRRTRRKAGERERVAAGVSHMARMMGTDAQTHINADLMTGANSPDGESATYAWTKRPDKKNDRKYGVG